MSNSSHNQLDLAREFAVEVVQKLQSAGHQAVWAGGCVRDRLLGKPAKDYDVATSALPGEIRDLFGRRRTLAIGAAFGVITVLGPKGAGQIEVATFRNDIGYSDGRHPDAISFSSPEEDAQRRDFTINGLFYDPLAQRLFDYVGGQADLNRGLIRAIGNAAHRFAEDKLRMLRAVRFASSFRFAIEPSTLAAIQVSADTLRAVSAERIAAEMRRMLVHDQRADALRLLHESRLLGEVLPELASIASEHDSLPPHDQASSKWRRILGVLARLSNPSFPLALTAALYETPAAENSNLAKTVGRRWRLANEEIDLIAKVLQTLPLVQRADSIPWPTLQRILISPWFHEVLNLAEAICAEVGADPRSLEFCRDKLNLPAAELNPLPLISGDDLVHAGLSPGPAFHRVLTEVRNAQLERRIATAQEALALAVRLAADPESP